MAKISLIANEERARIAEHAFRTGYKLAAERALAFYPTKIEDSIAHENAAWNSCEPEEESEP